MKIQVGIDPGKARHQVCFLCEAWNGNRSLNIASDHQGFQRIPGRLDSYRARGGGRHRT